MNKINIYGKNENKNIFCNNFCNNQNCFLGKKRNFADSHFNKAKFYVRRLSKKEIENNNKIKNKIKEIEFLYNMNRYSSMNFVKTNNTKYFTNSIIPSFPLFSLSN